MPDGPDETHPDHDYFLHERGTTTMNMKYWQVTTAIHYMGREQPVQHGRVVKCKRKPDYNRIADTLANHGGVMQALCGTVCVKPEKTPEIIAVSCEVRKLDIDEVAEHMEDFLALPSDVPEYTGPAVDDEEPAMNTEL